MAAVTGGELRARLETFAGFVSQWSHALAETPGELLVLARNSAGRGPVAEAAEPRLVASGRSWIARDPRPPSAEGDAVAERTLIGHRDKVTAVRFTPDRARVVSASSDGDLRIWDARTGKCLAVIAHPFREPVRFDDALGFDPRAGSPRPTRGVDDVVLLPDGRALTAGHDGQLRLWALESGAQLLALRGHEVDDWSWSGHVRLAIGCGGRLAASVAQGVRIWDLVSGELIRELEAWSFVASSCEAGSLVTGGPKGTAILWDLATGTIQRQLVGAKEWVGAGAVRDDGTLAATASWDGAIRVWEVATGECLRTIETSWGTVGELLLPPGSPRVLASGAAMVREWDLATGAPARDLVGTASPITALALAIDGDTIATGHDDGTVRLCRFAGREAAPGFERLPSRANSVAIAPDAAWALIGCEDGMLRVWDLHANHCSAVWPGHGGSAPAQVPVGATGVALSGDAGIAVSVGFDKTLRIWDARRGTCSRVLETESQWGESEKGVVLSMDGRTALTWGSDHIQVWKTRDGKLDGRFRATTGKVESVWLSADGARAISIGGGDGPRVWDLRRRVCVHDLPRRWGRGGLLAVSPDGASACTIDGTSALLWSVAGTATLKLLGHRRWVSGASFSPDGRLLATAGSDGEVRVWRVDDGQCLALYRTGSGSPVNTLSAWSRTGALACCTADGSVHALRFHEGSDREVDSSLGRSRDTRLMPAPARATMRFEEGLVQTTAGTVECPACGSRAARFAGSFDDLTWETTFGCACGWEWVE